MIENISTIPPVSASTLEEAPNHTLRPSPCIYCQDTRAWILKDGRLKCPRCKNRWRQRSVWESFRISEERKRHLLQAFAHRLPFRSVAACQTVPLPTRDRFTRMARATLAYAEGYRSPLPLSSILRVERIYSDENDGWSPHGTVLIIELSISNGRITIAPLRDHLSPKHGETIIGAHAPGTLIHKIEQGLAYVWLWIRGHHVILPRRRVLSTRCSCPTDLDAYWDFTLHGADSIHRLTFARFHLFLGEMSYRFHRRNSNLMLSVLELLQTTPIHVIRPLLGPPPLSLHDSANSH